MNTSDFHDELIVRLPVLPLSCVDIIDRSFFEKNPDFLYVASLSLYQQRNKNRKEIDLALARYFSRLCTRPTPFGFFAGCGMHRWNEKIRLNIRHPKRYIRLDNLALHRLIQQLLKVPSVQDHLLYFPNNSHYSIHNQIRYAEYSLTGHRRYYTISEVAANESLQKVFSFCQQGAKLSAITSMLIESYPIDINEATSYVQQILENQLLVSELEPTITGEDYLLRAVKFLSSIQTIGDEASEVSATLEDIIVLLQRSNDGITPINELGSEVTALLKPWIPDLTEDRLFQVDTVFASLSPSTINPRSTSSSSFQLAAKQRQEINLALNALNKLTPKPTGNLLQDFTSRFFQRYEDREIPLPLALDAEIGINYLGLTQTAFTPLIEDIFFPQSERYQTIQWNQIEVFKWNLLRGATEDRQHTVILTDELLEELDAQEHDLPPSMSVTFRRLQRDQYYLEGAGGVSACNLLNRFAYTDDHFHRMVQHICQQEQQYNPEVIFADVVHLPESRVGNIVFHPVSRKYEIPYLAASAVPIEFQLPISDLYLSVRDGEIILRSHKLNKRIIPRLSTAHNHHMSELPIYRFLSDLQSQGLRTNLSFQWGALAHRFRFLPRVVYRNTVLHPATWQLNETDVTELRKAKNQDEFQRAFRRWRKRWRLPQRWVLADGDNELLVNSEQPLTIESWWKFAKRRNQFVIKEFFIPNQEAVVNEQGEAHVHQLVATWIKQQSTYRSEKVRQKIPETIRSFLPGSEWLYFKIYCGVSSGDVILENVFNSLVERLQKEQIINQWFFVRYADPDTHLRLRFHLTDTTRLGEVIDQVHHTLVPFRSTGIISKVQVDTYHRELERYGGEATTKAEALFHYDSETVLKFLTLNEGDAREDIRWCWGLRSIDALLNDFDLELSEKLQLLTQLKEAFAQEHQIDKALKLQLDKHYRVHRSTIQDMFTTNSPGDKSYPLIEALLVRSNRQASTVATIRLMIDRNKLMPSLPDLLSSYIHMLVNRLIPTQARFHEMVMYDFLYREYRSAAARRKKVKVIP